jgi:hypothetical protein
MKLSEAIDFATQHQQFLNMLQQNNINPDVANGLEARIAHRDNQNVFVEIMVDYGFSGPGSNDVRARVHYHQQSGTFFFDNVAIRH